MDTKLKKHTVFVLGLWLLGAAGLSWIALDRKIEENRIAEHEKMLETKLQKLDKMIAGKEGIRQLAGAVPDEQWEQEFAEFQKRRKTIRPMVKNIATGFFVLGFLIVLFWIIKLLSKYALVQINSSSNFVSDIFKKQKGGIINEPRKLAQETAEKVSKQSFVQNSPERKNKMKRVKSKYEPVTDILSNRSVYDFQNINTLYCDEKSAFNTNKKESTKTAGTQVNPDMEVFDKFEENIRKTILSGYSEHATKVEDTLKERNASLEQQVKELKEMAKSVREAAEHSSSSSDESMLSNLAEQLTAIREFATTQQNRNEKLQEGYDWSIIKNFCLKVIRCIDNIESRIQTLTEKGVDAGDLEDIRDELVFSLESSGVEQFKPDINSSYSGQEKKAEVIKDKVPSDDESMKGKIAEVIRPGYKYMIDEDNGRVVRTARVKLYE